MDGTFAFLFLALGLVDMGVSHCGSGCLARDSTAPRLSLSAGEVIFQDARIGQEVYLRYEAARTYGPFQPVAGASVTSDGSLWGGVGAMWTQPVFGDRAFVQLHLMPGVYAQGGGVDLGHVVEFRSGLEVGFEANNGWRWSVGVDHRSNAEIGDWNPGLETVQLRLSIPLD